MALTGFTTVSSSRHVAIAVLLASTSTPVHAAPEEAADDLAQQLFSRGVDAARQNDWSDAREAFEKAYRLAPRLVVLINLAGAQARTGLLVEASRNYRRVLEASTSPETAEYGEAAKAILPSLEARIPRIQITPAGLGPSDVVAIDGNQVPASALKGPVLVDPGTHTLTVRRDGVQRARIDFSVAESESHDISLPSAVFVLSPAPRGQGASDGATVPLSPTTGPPPPGDRGRWWTSPWFWAATAGVVAASTVALVLVEQHPQPYSGNVGPGIVNVP